MSDDVDDTLSALEARLRELQAELEAVPGRPGAPASPDPDPDPDPAPASPRRAPEPEPGDPLDQFGVELRRLAGELVGAWDRVVAHERARPAARHRLLLETQADLHALAALERALCASPDVRDVDLRAYAGGHASLLVDLG